MTPEDKQKRLTEIKKRHKHVIEAGSISELECFAANDVPWLIAELKAAWAREEKIKNYIEKRVYEERYDFEKFNYSESGKLAEELEMILIKMALSQQEGGG